MIYEDNNFDLNVVKRRLHEKSIARIVMNMWNEELNYCELLYCLVVVCALLGVPYYSTIMIIIIIIIIIIYNNNNDTNNISVTVNSRHFDCVIATYALFSTCAIHSYTCACASIFNSEQRHFGV